MDVKELAHRFRSLPAGDVTAGLRLRAGTLADYAALAEFHYLRRRPATVTRILVFEDTGWSVAERYARLMRQRGARFAHVQRSDRAKEQVIAVLVESMPALACALRETALGGRYGGMGDRRAAARLINAEVRCISRVIVHPQWRGLGLAVRLVREALRTMPTAYTEALAAMGRVHPFFERAGMRAYRRWPLRRDQRLIDAMRWAGVEPWRLADTAWMKARLTLPMHRAPDHSQDACVPWTSAACPCDTMHRQPEQGGDIERYVLRRELRRWAGPRLDLDQQLNKAQRTLLREPVYYIAERRTWHVQPCDRPDAAPAPEGPGTTPCPEGLAVPPPPPRPVEPRPLDRMPAVVHFFLTGRQKRRLERVLDRIGGQRTDALMQLIHRAAAMDSADGVAMTNSVCHCGPSPHPTRTQA